MHQSLVDRLTFMSEDDVRTDRTQQGRGVTGGGSSDSGSGSEDNSRAGKERPSSVAVAPASGGGAAASGVGPRGEPRQLLVLIGDAGGNVSVRCAAVQPADGRGASLGLSAPDVWWDPA